jgi:photosynthetic reaction center cytochrome c subunit
MPASLTKSGLFLVIAAVFSYSQTPQVLHAQTPTPTVVDSPGVKVLTGLLAPDFQEEMNHMVQATGGSCNSCHVRGNFASEDHPKKIIARRMLEMTRAINKQFFPDHKPKPGESVLGKVTCYTCHQGETTPKLPPGD